MWTNFVGVTPPEINDDDSNYQDVIKWFRRQENYANRLDLTEKQIIGLNEVWDIINEINVSMIGVFEDDCIYDNAIQKKYWID